MRRLLTAPLTAVLSLSLLTAAPTIAFAKRATPATETRPETRARTRADMLARRADMLARRAADARATVEKHFTALAAADAKAVRALWTRDARIISIDAANTAKKQSLSTALTRWLTHTDGLQWEILQVRHITDAELEITATVTWNGAAFDDTLRVVKHGNRMLIRHKSSRPHITAAEAKPPRSPY